MTRNKKQEIINTLTEEFKIANCVVMSDFKGLTVSDLEVLRKSARAKNVKVQVIKNTLATISLKNAELEGIDLTDTNIFVWGEDSVATSKVASDFAKDNEGFVLKNAYVDNKASDIATVEAFAKLPGRDELLGMLAATWMAPIQNFTIGLDALSKKKEEESA